MANLQTSLAEPEIATTIASFLTVRILVNYAFFGFSYLFFDKLYSITEITYTNSLS